jgi:hypothetical protein
MTRRLEVSGEVAGYIWEPCGICTRRFSASIELPDKMRGQLKPILSAIIEEEGKTDFQEVTGLQNLYIELVHEIRRGVIARRAVSLFEFAA